MEAARRMAERPRRTTVKQQAKALRKMRRWVVDPEVALFMRDCPPLGSDSLEALNHRLWQVQGEVALQHATYRSVMLEELDEASASDDRAALLMALETLTDMTLRTAGVVKRVAEAQANLSKLHLVHELDKQLSEISIKVDGWREEMAKYAERAASAEGSEAVH